MRYILAFFLPFVLSVVLVPLIAKVAKVFKIVDKPDALRKFHKKPTPLLGGLAMFLSFSLFLWLYILFEDPYNFIPTKQMLGLFLGSVVLMVGGFLDDKYSLPAWVTWFFPFVAVTVVMCFGVGSNFQLLSNPVGDPVALNFLIYGVPVSSVVTWLWLMGMTFTTKLLDGLDGLASSVSLVAGVVLFLLALVPRINQPVIAVLSLFFCGAVAGFLVWNWNPAKVFMGEGGSTWLGFTLGVISVILGGKIATAALVLGVPILDVFQVIVSRVLAGGSPFKSDRRQLHLRLIDAGYSVRAIVAMFVVISGIFGSVAILAQTTTKLVAGVILAFVFLALVSISVRVLPKSS